LVKHLYITRSIAIKKSSKQKEDQKKKGVYK